MDTHTKSDKRAAQIARINELLEENRLLNLSVFQKLTLIVSVNTEMRTLSKFFETPAKRVTQ